jgi:hypothetical protein
LLKNLTRGGGRKQQRAAVAEALADHAEQSKRFKLSSVLKPQEQAQHEQQQREQQPQREQPRAGVEGGQGQEGWTSSNGLLLGGRGSHELYLQQQQPQQEEQLLGLTLAQWEKAGLKVGSREQQQQVQEFSCSTALGLMSTFPNTAQGDVWMYHTYIPRHFTFLVNASDHPSTSGPVEDGVVEIAYDSRGIKQCVLCMA